MSQYVDKFGNEIKAGAFIAYPSRCGSGSAEQNIGRVVVRRHRTVGYPGRIQPWLAVVGVEYGWGTVAPRLKRNGQPSPVGNLSEVIVLAPSQIPLPIRELLLSSAYKVSPDQSEHDS